MGPARPPRLENLVGHYLVRSTKPKLASSHDWHVQLCCQRSVTDNRLGGPFGSRTQARKRYHVSSNLMRCFCLGGTTSTHPLASILDLNRRFASSSLSTCANFSKVSNFRSLVNLFRCFSLLALSAVGPFGRSSPAGTDLAISREQLVLLRV